MATVAEIGKLAGCSGATVSRVVNKSASVNPEIRNAVLDVLRRVEYPQGRTGRRGRPPGSRKSVPVKLVELLYYRDTPIEKLSFEDGKLSFDEGSISGTELFSKPNRLSGFFYQQIADGVVKELERWGYKGVLEFSDDLTGPDALAKANKPDRAGILLMGEDSPELKQFVKRCVHPVVLVDLIHDGDLDYVTTDNQAGIAAAFDHLRSLGHHRLGFVGKWDASVGFKERFAAFKLKMAEAGLPIVPEWIAECPSRFDQAEIAAAKLLSHPDRPTALICANDLFALGAMRAAVALGIRIPGQLSIVGFDDHESASLVTPALTTIRVPVSEMGSQAARQLMLQVHHPNGRGCGVRLPSQLIVRASTGKCQ